MSLNTGGFSRRNNMVIIPTRTKNYIVASGGTFNRAPVIATPRIANIFAPKSNQQIEQERQQAYEHLIQQQHHRVIVEEQAIQAAQQAAQAPAYHGVPSIYNQTGAKS